MGRREELNKNGERSFLFTNSYLLCWLFRELGDFESAMESFQKALLLDQNHIQSLQLRGMMLYHHGSLQEAIGNFKVQVVPAGDAPLARL